MSIAKIVSYKRINLLEDVVSIINNTIHRYSDLDSYTSVIVEDTEDIFYLITNLQRLVRFNEIRLMDRNNPYKCLYKIVYHFIDAEEFVCEDYIPYKVNADNELKVVTKNEIRDVILHNKIGTCEVVVKYTRPIRRF